MSRKIIITFLIFFTPIAIIEQYKKDKSSEIAIEEFNSKSNFHQLDRLLDNNNKNSIEIKSCWEKGDLASQKRYCSSAENFWNNF